MKRMHASPRLLGVLAGCLIAGASAAGTTHPSAEAVQPRQTGQQVPAATVQTLEGEPVELRALVRDEGALLVFYRGGW